MEVLGCEEAEPSPRKGVPCVDWCARYHEGDYMPPWSGCVGAATTVEAVKACGLKCR